MDPNKGNPYMQGENPFMQDPPKPGAPQETSVAGGEMDAGMAPMENGTSETTKPRQLPGGTPPQGVPGMDVGIGEPGASDPAANGPQDSPPSPAVATAVLRQVRAEIRRTNPDVDVVDAHLLAQAVVDLIFTAAPVTPIPDSRVTPHNPLAGNGTWSRRPRNNQQLGDLNNPNNPNSPLHPAHPMNPRRQQADPAQPDDGKWHPQNGGYTPFDDKAYGAGYRGQYPYSAGAAMMAGEKIRDRWRNRHSGQTPPNQDHPDSRQIPR